MDPLNEEDFVAALMAANAESADEDDGFMSSRQIQAASGLTLAQVRKRLERLAEQGRLVYEKRPRRSALTGKATRVHCYKILPER